MKINLTILFVLTLSLGVLSCSKETATDDSLSLGDKMDGGIVVYIDATGEHGIIMSPELTAVAPWGCTGTYISGTSPTVGSGQANTSLILSCGGNTMAKYCDDYVRDGFSDWYMPSKNEVELIYQYHKNKGLLWQGSASSTQMDTTNAYGLDGNGTSGWAPKSMSYYTIPCRSF